MAQPTKKRAAKKPYRQRTRDENPGETRGVQHTLDPAKIAIFERALTIGASRGDSALYAGIARRTFYYWLERARAAREAKRESIFTRFLDAVELAEARSIVHSLDWIKKGKDNWQAHAWFLERKRAEEWGRPWRQDTKGGDDNTVQVIRLPAKAGSVEEWSKDSLPVTADQEPGAE